MRKKKRSFLQLFLGALLCAGLIYFLINYSPSSSIGFNQLQLPSLLAFFILLISSVSFLAGFLLRNLRRGFFLSLFVSAYLILRLNNVTHLFFLILLVCLFVVIELFFKESNA